MDDSTAKRLPPYIHRYAGGDVTTQGGYLHSTFHDMKRFVFFLFFTKIFVSFSAKEIAVRRLLSGVLFWGRVNRTDSLVIGISPIWEIFWNAANGCLKWVSSVIDDKMKKIKNRNLLQMKDLWL